MNATKRDWFRVLWDLKLAGWSYGAVARRIGRNPATVHAWSEGVEPKESDARMVLALYAKHCPEKYIEHQKAYDIRVTVQAVAAPGDQDRLPFVEVG